MTQRLGGMHWLMSFVGCISVLMENSSLVPSSAYAFTIVPKMLKGKKLPMNVSALRFIVLKLLRCFAGYVTSFEKL